MENFYNLLPTWVGKKCLLEDKKVFVVNSFTGVRFCSLSTESERKPVRRVTVSKLIQGRIEYLKTRPEQELKELILELAKNTQAGYIYIH